MFLHIQRFRTKRCTRFRGQALCIQRRHVKRSVRRFYRRAASFCGQGADRHVCLCFDFRIACRSRERACVYTAIGRNNKRAGFCFGERDIVICLDGRTILRAEFLDLEHAMCDDLCLSFFRDQGAVREGGLCDIGIGEVAAGGIGAVLDGSFIRDVHRPRFRGVRARRQLAAVGDGHRTSLCGMAAIFDGSFIRDAHRPCFCGVCPRRQLAAVFDGHRTSLCGIAAVLDGSFIREGDRTAGQRDIFHDTAFAVVINRSSAARKCRILNGCSIRDGECLCSLYLRTAEIRLIGQGGLCACEGAASDGAIIHIIDVECFSCLRIIDVEGVSYLRIINVEGFSCLVAAIRDLAVVGDGGIFCLDGSCIRCRFTEEGDVGVARRLETDAARHRTAVFRFCPRHFHAEGLSFALAFDIDYVFDGNILPFDVRVGGAHFLIGIMTVFCIEAVALEVECHIAIGGVNGMDDKVAVFRERDAFLCAGSEGAAFFNGDAGYCLFAGLEDDLVLRAHSDILEVVRRLHAEFSAGEELAPFLDAGIAGKIDGAIFCFCDEFPVRICRNGADGADGDGLVIYMEIPALCGRESDQLVCRQALDLLFRREVDHLSVFLASDATHVLAIFHFAAKRCQGDILPRDMRGFFLRGLGIGDALFDAAAGVGDEKILRGLRRADKDFCLFLRREVIIRFQVARFERSIAIDLAVRAVRDPLHIGFDAILRPSVDTAFQLIIALLFLCYIRIDVSDALLCQCLLRGVVQRVLAVFHIPLEGLILIVLALYLGNEEGLLF